MKLWMLTLGFSGMTLRTSDMQWARNLVNPNSRRCFRVPCSENFKILKLNAGKF